MIYATIVTILHISKNEREHEVSTDHVYEGADAPHLTTPSMEMSVQKTVSFKSIFSAIHSFQKIFKKNTLQGDIASQFGMLIHKGRDINHEKHVDLYQLSNDKVQRRSIINPLWKGLNPSLRDRIANVMTLDVNEATQSQLFAMVTGNGADSKWMQSFQLKDKQQTDLYIWEQGAFPRENNLSPEEMVLIASNMVNYAKLPPLPVNFKQSGKACFFSVSLANGKVIDPESAKNDENKGAWSWLINVDNTSHERVGERSTKKEDGLRISALSLTMIMDWALSAPVIIHEVSHYIDFVTPNPYRLNKGTHRLSFKEYETVFAGHGASFVSIFARALIDFYGVNEDDMYDSLNASDLDHFYIKTIKTEDIIKGMDRYILDLRSQN